jgi:TetR/AcrR family transcriptional regulator, fatty acid metabolism regulator protein
MAPAVQTEHSAAGKLRAYIRANCLFLDAHRTESVAMFEILTSFRTADGLRLDEAIARSVAVKFPPSEMALLDPRHIVEEGVRTGRGVRRDPPFRRERDPGSPRRRRLGDRPECLLRRPRLR